MQVRSGHTACWRAAAPEVHQEKRIRNLAEEGERAGIRPFSSRPDAVQKPSSRATGDGSQRMRRRKSTISAAMEMVSMTPSQADICLRRKPTRQQHPGRRSRRNRCAPVVPAGIAVEPEQRGGGDSQHQRRRDRRRRPTRAGWPSAQTAGNRWRCTRRRPTGRRSRAGRAAGAWASHCLKVARRGMASSSIQRSAMAAAMMRQADGGEVKARPGAGSASRSGQGMSSGPGPAPTVRAQPGKPAITRNTWTAMRP